MNAVVKENIANNNMKNPPFVLGVIPAPDNIKKPVLYSHVQASQDFSKINEDIYISKKKHKPIDRKRTPQAVIYTVGTAALYGLWRLAKHIIKKK